MSAALETLRSAADALDGKAPAGGARLATLHRPPSGDLPKRLYANFDAYWLAGVLYQLREARRDGRLDLAAARSAAALFAGNAAGRLQLWGFEEEATAIGSAVSDIAKADAKELDLLLAEAVLVLDKLNAWVDATIPWADLETVKPLGEPGVLP